MARSITDPELWTEAGHLRLESCAKGPAQPGPAQLQAEPATNINCLQQVLQPFVLNSAAPTLFWPASQRGVLAGRELAALLHCHQAIGPYRTWLQVFVLLFGVGASSVEGVHTIRVPNPAQEVNDVVVAFEAQHDASRYTCCAGAACLPLY